MSWSLPPERKTSNLTHLLNNSKLNDQRQVKLSADTKSTNFTSPSPTTKITATNQPKAGHDPKALPFRAWYKSQPKVKRRTWLNFKQPNHETINVTTIKEGRAVCKLMETHHRGGADGGLKRSYPGKNRILKAQRWRKPSSLPKTWPRSPWSDKET